MEEIKQELRQDNINVKCNAVAKLTYVSTAEHLIVFISFLLSVQLGLYVVFCGNNLFGVLSPLNDLTAIHIFYFTFLLFINYYYQNRFKCLDMTSHGQDSI